MKHRRTLILSSLGLLLLTLALLFAHPRLIKSPLEAWIGSELQRIANHFINPELHFDKLVYHAPRTVILTNLTLTSPDPVDLTHSVTILSVKTAHLELAKIPHLGQALKIKQFILDTPEVRLIATHPPATSSTTQPAATQPHPKTHFIGFSNFLTKRKPAAPGAPPSKPSDFFQITKIEIHNGLLEYDPRLPGTQPFTLDNFTTTLNINANPTTSPSVATAQPADKSSNGWYVLDLNIYRAPIFTVKMQGRINVNTLAIEFSPLTATLALNAKTQRHLPPNIQKVVDHYQAQGTLSTIVTGSLLLKDMSNTQLLTHISLNDGHASIGAYQIPIQKLVAELRTENGLTRAKSLDASVLNGSIHAEGSLPFRGDQTASLHIRINNVGLARTLRTFTKSATTTAASQPAVVAGRISGEISYSAPMANWNTQATGSGHLKLEHGRIPELPLLGDMFAGIRSIKKTFGIDNGKPDDSAEVAFLFQGNKAIVQTLLAHSSSMGLRAQGDIFADGRVDLLVNAGPLERIELLLGPVGDVLSDVTDNIASYHVTGKAGHLTIAAQVGR